MENLSPAYLLPIIFVVITQLVKYADPIFFEKIERWVTVGLALLGGVLNVVYMIATEQFVAPNDAAFGLMVLAVILEGIILGMSASGLYEMVRDTAPGTKSSTVLVYEQLSE